MWSEGSPNDNVTALRRISLAVALTAALGSAGCAAMGEGLFSKEDAPSYFTQVTATGYLYAHNWPDRPCFTVELPGQGWRFLESTPDNAQWMRDTEVLRIYLTDNRDARFAVSDMNEEDVLRTFVAYEIEYVQPWFDFHITATPLMAEDFNGVWMQWGWEGHGGKRRAARVDEPADQRHVVHSLWLDPWVLSLDWATTDLTVEGGATPVKINTLESITFQTECFSAMMSNQHGRTVATGTGTPPVDKTPSGGYIRRTGSSRPPR